MDKFLVNKPWGNFLCYTKNELTTVKILTISPNQELSLQYHSHRSEFFRIIKGNPTVIIGDKSIEAKANDEFDIPRGVQHQIIANDNEVQVLEISFGDFDEEDIVRIKDKYGRIKK